MSVVTESRREWPAPVLVARCPPAEQSELPQGTARQGHHRVEGARGHGAV